MTEEWRPVLGSEGHYEVSSHGRVRGLDRRVKWRNQYASYTQRVPARELKQFIVRRYLKVSIYTDGVLKQRTVHSLVAEAFHGPRPPGMHVCHGDGDNFNNQADNLRYDTPKANVEDSIRHGRRKKSRPIRTHCYKGGHVFDAANTGYAPNGARYCKACAKETHHRYYVANRSQRQRRELKRARREKRVSA